MSNMWPNPCSDRDVGVYVITEWIAIGQHARQRHEDARHAHAWIADWAAQRGKPAQRQPWCGHQGVGEQHTNQNHIHEEPLDATFGDSEILVRQIARDDADIVCAVPIARRGPPDEVEVRSHARAAGLAGIAECERSGFGRIAQQPFVQRPPPWAARPGVALAGSEAPAAVASP